VPGLSRPIYSVFRRATCPRAPFWTLPSFGGLLVAFPFGLVSRRGTGSCPARSIFRCPPPTSRRFSRFFFRPWQSWGEALKIFQPFALPIGVFWRTPSPVPCQFWPFLILSFTLEFCRPLFMVKPGVWLPPLCGLPLEALLTPQTPA